MGSGKLEEREGSLVAAKHPQSRPCGDAPFPSGARLSVVRAQIRPGREAALRGDRRRVEPLFTSPPLPPASTPTSTLPL